MNLTALFRAAVVTLAVAQAGSAWGAWVLFHRYRDRGGPSVASVTDYAWLAAGTTLGSVAVAFYSALHLDAPVLASTWLAAAGQLLGAIAWLRIRRALAREHAHR